MSNFCNFSKYSLGFVPAAALSCLAWQLGDLSVEANPAGGAVVPGQGAATFNPSGSQFTINQTSANVVINWSSFNIASGETTTFVQPSASSVAWNQINDPNPSQILGHLDANGFVVLQNQNGFVVGGNAAIKAAGLVMTTSPTPAPNLSSGGAWEFDAPPPSAQIINYGKISVSDGGSLFLIASDIENRNGTDSQGVNGVGTLSAPGGKIGLYAGEQVLLSTSPNGHGLSAKVTLPEGSVDNAGNLIADGGTIAALARTVNQNGLVQANAVQNVNGVIELVATGDLTVGAHSDIEANGDNTSASASPGGFVVLQAGGSYSDTPTSVINVSGQNSGQDGVVEVLAANLDNTVGITGDANSVQSTIGNNFALFLNPFDLTISSDPTDPSQPNFNATDLASYGQIDLHALDNIELSARLSLGNSTAPTSLSLQAGNSIILDQGIRLTVGNNWGVNLDDGSAFVPTLAQPMPAPAGGDGSYSYGVYLDDGAVVQGQNGDIHVSAVNEVIIHAVDLSGGAASSGTGGAIRTLAGGSIFVNALYGDVNAGNGPYGYSFGLAAPPYYSVNKTKLGGISTAAGGDVTINAGGNVLSYLPTQADYNNGFASDGGTGAFGLSNPGNVTIHAGGSVFGNYVVADGTGTISADGDIGVPATPTTTGTGFALSLVKGSWSVYAQNIYLDDVMNPNGVFNDSQNNPAGAHLFDYNSNDSLLLDAVNDVQITGGDVPLLAASSTGLLVPVLLPPSLQVITGAGGFNLAANVILFPSATGNLNITTSAGGNFASLDNNVYNLQMSGSAQRQWSPNVGAGEGTEIFGYGDQAAAPVELNNLNPVEIDISGNMDNVNVYATKQTGLTVHHNMFNSGFVGENLHASDVSTITVDGSVSFSPIYSFITLNQALPLGWDAIFSLLVNPLDLSSPIPNSDVGNETVLKSMAASDLVFPAGDPNPGFVYNPATKQLGYAYQMSALVQEAMDGTLLGNGSKGVYEAIKLDAFGNPEVQLGQTTLGQDPTKYYFVTTTVSSYIPAAAVDALYNNSLGLAPNSTPAVQDAQHLSVGFQIGGPGQLNINVLGSMNLGATAGILSWGGADGAQSPGGIGYVPLDTLTGNSGAAINVQVGGNLDMITSSIASIGGGNVTVASTGGEINLGLGGLSLTPSLAGNLAYGIFTAGAGNVSVTAYQSIDIDTARIATFNGGNVFVESMDGDVNAGNGANMDLLMPYYFYDSKSGAGLNTVMEQPRPYGSGILALSPSLPYQISPGTTKGGGELPGNITVETPNGNIVSTLGGIAQFALNGNVAGGPTVTLSAGTPGTAASKTQGNIDLGEGGVIGGDVNLSAQGNISGLIISRQNTTVTAVQNVDVTVLSGGNANVAAGGALSGTLIGMGSVNASGGQGISATMLSGNVSANGSAGQSTLGAATTSAASQSAANQSNTETKQELASNTSSDDDQKKKKHSLSQRVKRVTVILPKT